MIHDHISPESNFTLMMLKKEPAVEVSAAGAFN